MKFVLVEAPEGATPRQRELRWTYVCEGNPKVGDVIFASFGYEDEYMTVVKTATQRAKLGVEYDGPVKSARLATEAELALREKILEAWAKVDAAEERAGALEDRLLDLRDRLALA